MNDMDIERILKSAGPRSRPPAEVEQAVREQLRREWRSIVAEQRASTQRRVRFALAAGLAAAALGVWMTMPLRDVPADPVATIALAAGEVRARSGLFSRWQPAGNGLTLSAGQTLMTGADGRSAVTIPGGVSARLDHDTRIRLASAERIFIERGALYVDAGRDSAASARLDVVTPAGSLRHLGTQYEVRLIGSDVRIRVREGRVEWSPRNGGAQHGEAGEQLTIASDGAVSRDALLRHGDAWEWAAAAAPGIDIEGRPLTEFLDWAGRELGRDISFSSPEVAAQAAGIIVHGSIAGLTPTQALDAVLATTRLRSAVTGDGRIVIGPQ